MNLVPENRKTRIDFGRLKFHPERNAHAKPTSPIERDNGRYGEKLNGATTKRSQHSLSPQGKIENPAGLKPLVLPELIRSGIRTHASPWEMYEKSYDIRLGAENAFVTVAERRKTSRTAARKPFSSLVLVKRLSGASVEDKLRKLQQIQDASIASPIEIFNFGGAYDVVFEYMAYSLYYVTGNPFLNEIRLAAIVGQVRPSKHH